MALRLPYYVKCGTRYYYFRPRYFNTKMIRKHRPRGIIDCTLLRHLQCLYKKTS